MPNKLIDITGQQFGSLTALCQHGISVKTGQALWLCLCSCGNKTTVLGYSLRCGDTKSCGCLVKKQALISLQKAHQKKITHGQSGNKEYRTWQAMKERCNNRNNISYKNYGGRGVKICKEWENSFEAFYHDMGKRPLNMSFDRINNDGNYEPSNCQWATRKDQNNNKRSRRRYLKMDELIEIQQAAKTFPTLPDEIISSNMYSEIGNWLLTAKEKIKDIQNYFKPRKKDAEIAYKNWIMAEKDALAPYHFFSENASKLMTNWNIEQEKIRKAEEERLRLEAIKREEEERLQAAIQAEKEGSKEEAQAILNEPVFVPPPVVPNNVPKQNGLTMRETWQFRVTDLKALVKAVAEGKVPLMAIKPDDVFLGQQARSLKGTVNYPGVEFYSVKNMTGVRR